MLFSRRAFVARAVAMPLFAGLSGPTAQATARPLLLYDEELGAGRRFAAHARATGGHAVALSGDHRGAADLAAIPDALASVLGLEPEVIAMARDQAHADRLLVLARGYEYATAREWALKVKELAHVFADPYSAADFEHGPIALLESGVPVLATVRPGRYTSILG